LLEELTMYCSSNSMADFVAKKLHHSTS